MRYFCFQCAHPSLDEPRFLLCELDERGTETRKVEIYRDGRKGFAGIEEHFGSTRLMEQPIPAAEMVSHAQIEARAISRYEFEDAWARRKRSIPWLRAVP